MKPLLFVPVEYENFARLHHRLVDVYKRMILPFMVQHVISDFQGPIWCVSIREPP